MIGKLGFSGEVEDRAVEALIHGKYRIIAPEHASEAVELVAPVIAEAAYRAGIEDAKAKAGSLRIEDARSPRELSYNFALDSLVAALTDSEGRDE